MPEAQPVGRRAQAVNWVIGLAAPLALGFMLPHLAALAPDMHPYVAFVVLCAVGVLCGVLLCRRRAVFLVPAAFLLGMAARLWAEYALELFGGQPDTFPSVHDHVEVVFVGGMILVLPLVLGAALGLPVGVWLRDCWQRRSSRPWNEARSIPTMGSRKPEQ